MKQTKYVADDSLFGGLRVNMKVFIFFQVKYRSLSTVYPRVTRKRRKKSMKKLQSLNQTLMPNMKKKEQNLNRDKMNIR